MSLRYIAMFLYPTCRGEENAIVAMCDLLGWRIDRSNAYNHWLIIMGEEAD